MNNNKKFSAIRQAGLIAGVLLGAAIAAQAQPASPEGIWDFRISGSQRGVAFVTFNKDNTLNGWEIVTHRPHSTGSSNPRGGTNSAPSTSTDSFFGYTPLSGNWNQA